MRGQFESVVLSRHVCYFRGRHGPLHVLWQEVLLGSEEALGCRRMNQSSEVPLHVGEGLPTGIHCWLPRPPVSWLHITTP